MVMSETHSAQGLRSASKTLIQIKRGDMSLDIVMEGWFDETADGKPIAMHTRQAMGAGLTEEHTEFTADGLKITTIANGKTTHTTKPLPEGEWLTPGAAERAVASAIANGQTTISIRSIDPTLGAKPVVMTRKIKERTTAEAFGKTVPAIKWTVTADLFPGVESTEYADEKGLPIRSETNMGGIKVVQLLADKELALRPTDAPELLVSMLITAGGKAEHLRTLHKASYLLRVEEGDMPEIGPGPGQTVERVDARTVRVTLSTSKDGATCLAPGGSDAQDATFTNSPRMLDHQDPAVHDLLKQIKLDGLAPAAKAEAIRQFVYRYIAKKDMSVGFATATEVARTKVGDCTEHGVLLAALLRAAGIPSRVCSGLVAIPGRNGEVIFGYHMWTEGLYADDGTVCWHALDAAIDAKRPFDATHILFSTSSLQDEQTMNFMVAYAPLLNRLKVDIERAE